MSDHICSLKYYDEIWYVNWKSELTSRDFYLGGEQETELHKY